MTDASCPKHKHHTYGCKACKSAQIREDERVFRETGKVPERANGRTWVEALMEHQHVGGHCWTCEASRWARVELKRDAEHAAALEARVTRLERLVRDVTLIDIGDDVNGIEARLPYGWRGRRDAALAPEGEERAGA